MKHTIILLSALFFTGCAQPEIVGPGLSKDITYITPGTQSAEYDDIEKKAIVKLIRKYYLLEKKVTRQESRIRQLEKNKMAIKGDKK